MHWSLDIFLKMQEGAECENAKAPDIYSFKYVHKMYNEIESKKYSVLCYHVM